MAANIRSIVIAWNEVISDVPSRRNLQRTKLNNIISRKWRFVLL